MKKLLIIVIISTAVLSNIQAYVLPKTCGGCSWQPSSKYGGPTGYTSKGKIISCYCTGYKDGKWVEARRDKDGNWSGNRSSVRILDKYTGPIENINGELQLPIRGTYRDSCVECKLLINPDDRLTLRCYCTGYKDGKLIVAQRNQDGSVSGNRTTVDIPLDNSKEVRNNNGELELVN